MATKNKVHNLLPRKKPREIPKFIKKIDNPNPEPKCLVPSPPTRGEAQTGGMPLRDRG